MGGRSKHSRARQENLKKAREALCSSQSEVETEGATMSLDILNLDASIPLQPLSNRPGTYRGDSERTKRRKVVNYAKAAAGCKLLTQYFHTQQASVSANVIVPFNC